MFTPNQHAESNVTIIPIQRPINQLMVLSVIPDLRFQLRKKTGKLAECDGKG